jgi:hypothetical protein
MREGLEPMGEENDGSEDGNREQREDDNPQAEASTKELHR